jgi:hypothetical protein
MVTDPERAARRWIDAAAPHRSRPGGSDRR